MPRIFVTGDTHGNIDIRKLNAKQFPTQKELTRDDIVIICGDWGGVWDGAGSDRYVQNWYKRKNFTTCWLDGNHENFDILERFPVEMWNGGKIHRIAKKIIHLMRGQVYEINGKTFYVMGGAVSIDKMWRTPGRSWWPQEQPSFAEEQEGYLNLQQHGDRVDYILTHDGPATLVAAMYAKNGKSYSPDPVSCSFDALVGPITFEHWFFGHHHEDTTMGKYTCCYQNIYEIMENGQITQKKR